MPAFSLVQAPPLGYHRGFTARTTLPYPSRQLNHEGLATPECHNFGGVLEPRYIVGAESLDQ